MKLQSLFLSSLTAIALGLSGCATIMSGSTQAINVQAIDSQTHQVIPGATCTLFDGEGRAYPVTGNPGAIVATRGKGSLQVKCRARGYHQSQTGVGQSFNAWIIANVLFWPGIIVDACTGATQKYPSHITVLMSKG